MPTKKQPGSTLLMGWPTLKLKVGVVAKIAACAIVMSLAACGNNDDPNGGKAMRMVKMALKQSSKKTLLTTQNTIFITF